MAMLYLVAYDISDNKRRSRLHKALCGFGEWTQYSFFECFLNEQELVMLRRQLDELLKPEEDNVRIYQVCHACQKRAETIGSTPPQEATLYLC